MYIQQLSIQNFRGIKETEQPIKFENGLNVLIGNYNACKSTILLAIKFLIDSDIPWWNKSIIKRFDFHDISQSIEINAIICCDNQLCIDEDSNNCDLFLNTDGNNSCKFSEISSYYNLKTNNFISLEEYEELSEDDKKELNRAIQIKLSGNYIEEEAYSEVNHEIFNYHKNEYQKCTRSMREWLNLVYYSDKFQMNNHFGLTRRSYLSRNISNFNEIRADIITKLIENFSDPLDIPDIENIFCNQEDLTNFLPSYKKIRLALDLNNDYSFIKQFRLSIQNGAKNIPIEYQGTGFLRITYLILSLLNVKQNINYPIAVLDEIEGSLDPQRQRGLINLIKTRIGQKAQIIISTHSPFILSSIINLKNVYKITNNDSIISQINLGLITGGNFSFINVQKNVEYDTLAFESLFSNFVILWEGDTEYGFFPEILNHYKSNSANWFKGVNCQGDNLNKIAKWYKNADYNILCILDHDNEGKKVIRKLKASNISYLTLPEDWDFEKYIEKIMEDLDAEKKFEIILNYECQGDEVFYYNSKPPITECSSSFFSALIKISGRDQSLGEDKNHNYFNSNGWNCEKNLIFSQFQQKKINIDDFDIANFLRRRKNYKNANSLAFFISKSFEEYPSILSQFLDKIYEIYLNNISDFQGSIDQYGVVNIDS